MPASCRLVALLVAICAAVALSVPSSVSLGYLRASGNAALPSALPLRQVIRLRGGSDAAVADPVQATPSVTPTLAAASEVVDPAQENVRSAIDTLRNKCSDTGRTNEEVGAAVGLALLYVENIAKNPTEAKFRKIKTSNKNFEAKIGSLPCADEIMLSCGFAATQDEGETFFVMTEEKAGNLVAEIAALKSALQVAQAVSADTLGQIITSGTGEEEEPQFEEVYQLSSQMLGHTGDVRGVRVLPKGGLVTASRDKTVRTWKQVDGGHAFAEDNCLEGHEYHLASVAVGPVSKENPDGLIFSGSYDLTSHGKIETPPVIKIWKKGEGCIRTLEGHTATVSTLEVSADGKTLYSGSWDKSVRIWDVATGECLATLQGHEAAVWAILPISGGKILTGSADRTIRLWDTVEKKEIGVLRGHGDCVRALIACGDSGVFASAGNDCSLKFWSLDLAGNSLDTSCGFCLQTLSGHDSFIYSLAKQENGDIISGAEDRTVKVWREGKLVSSIRLPDSVWSVAALENGDIAVACADGVLRVFTQCDERAAPAEEMTAYSTLVANRTMELKCALGGLQLDKLPGMEALERPGTSDGQTRVVRQGDKAFAYGWSATSNKWEPVGEVVDGPQQDRGNQIGAKTTHNGKEYDYVFQIEIEEGVTSKIAMNKNDNVYMVASDFIDEHDLNPDYLETIASWLDTEIEKIAPKKPQKEECLLDRDPFNEGKVYRAGSAQKLNEEGQVFYDPLTGKRLGGGDSSDEDNDDGPPKKAAKAPSGPPARHVPTSQTYHTFPGASKADAVIKKMTELNGNLPSGSQLSAEELASIAGIIEQVGGDGGVITSKVLSKWPRSALFPALDVLRGKLSTPEFATMASGSAMQGYSFAYADGAPTPEKLKMAQAGDLVLKIIMAASSDGVSEGDAPTPPTVLMSMRSICNTFAHAAFSPLLQIHTGTVAHVYKQAVAKHGDNKMVQSSFASVLLCYSIALKGLQIEDDALNAFLDAASTVMKSYTEESDVAGMYRLVAGVGTLIHGNSTRIQMALDKKIDQSVRQRISGLEAVKGGMGVSGDPKTQACCLQLMEMFDMKKLMSTPGIKHPDSDAEFDALIASATVPVIVDFYADWCGPCKNIAPVFEQLANDNADMVFVKVDVDDLKGTSQKCGVSAMPTFQFYMGGQKVHEMKGANEAGLKAAVETIKGSLAAAAAGGGQAAAQHAAAAGSGA